MHLSLGKFFRGAATYLVAFAPFFDGRFHMYMNKTRTEKLSEERSIFRKSKTINDQISCLRQLSYQHAPEPPLSLLLVDALPLLLQCFPRGRKSPVAN